MTMIHYTVEVKAGLLLALPTEAEELHLKPGDRVHIQLDRNAEEDNEVRPNEGMLAALRTIAERQKGHRYTEASQDLELMQENAATHLTSAICWHLLGNPGDETSIKVVSPHLCRCSGCRGTLHEILTIGGIDPAHPVIALLTQAEEWARWEAAGQKATLAARQKLQEHGVNIVYAREGGIWEEHPDGTVEHVGEIAALETSSR